MVIAKSGVMTRTSKLEVMAAVVEYLSSCAAAANVFSKREFFLNLVPR